MMADRSPEAMSCGGAVRALMDGRWDAWNGLAADCSTASVAGEFGGSEILDTTAYLGTAHLPCTRSTLDGAPIIVWHRRDHLLLVECDLLDAPRQPPRLAGTAIHRLDIHWGASLFKDGEAVFPERGLALILTSIDTVVACRGFSPMSIDEYVATRRPQSQPLKPFRPLTFVDRPKP